MTSFPQGIDSAGPPLVPSESLDDSDHTQLHQDAIDRAIAIQAFLGRPITSNNNEGMTVRQRLDALESAPTQSPVRSAIAHDVGPTNPPTVSWNNNTGELDFGIPRGKDGLDGTSSTSAAKASGAQVNVVLPPNQGPVGFNITFPPSAGITTPPLVFVTPVQKTVGSSTGGTTSAKTSVTAKLGRSYNQSGTKSQSTGVPGPDDHLYQGWTIPSSSHGNHRSLSILNGTFNAVPTGAKITSFTVTFKAPSGSGTNASTSNSTPVVLRPFNAPGGALPSTLVLSGTSQSFPKSGGYLAGTHTISMPTAWAQGFRDGTYNSLLWGPQPNNSSHHRFVMSSPVLTMEYTTSTASTPTDINSRPVLAGARAVTSTGFVLVVENLGSLTETVDVNWFVL